MAFTKLSAKVGQDNYPEINSKLLLANAPAIFTGIWAVAKGWIDEKTRKKVTIVGSSNTLKEMLKDIDIEQIPEFFGGQNKAGFLDDNGPWH